MGSDMATLTCNHPTLDGTPCQNLVTHGSGVCAAGHRVAFSITATTTASPAALLSEPGTVDGEDLMSSSTVQVSLGYRGLGDITPGVLDKDAEYVFMNGQCHALAIALAEKLDKPLFVFTEYTYSTHDQWWDHEYGDMDDPPSEQWLAEHWSHAVVQLGWDTYLDVNGISDEDELIETYGQLDSEHGKTAYSLFQVTPEQLGRFWQYGDGVEPAVEVARTFIEPVLEVAEEQGVVKSLLRR